MAIGEANGKSIYYKITIGYPDRLCGPPVFKQQAKWKSNRISINTNTVPFNKMQSLKLK